MTELNSSTADRNSRITVDLQPFCDRVIARGLPDGTQCINILS